MIKRNVKKWMILLYMLAAGFFIELAAFFSSRLGKLKKASDMKKLNEE